MYGFGLCAGVVACLIRLQSLHCLCRVLGGGVSVWCACSVGLAASCLLKAKGTVTRAATTLASQPSVFVARGLQDAGGQLADVCRRPFPCGAMQGVAVGWSSAYSVSSQLTMAHEVVFTACQQVKV